MRAIHECRVMIRLQLDGLSKVLDGLAVLALAEVYGTAIVEIARVWFQANRVTKIQQGAIIVPFLTIRYPAVVERFRVTIVFLNGRSVVLNGMFNVAFVNIKK